MILSKDYTDINTVFDFYEGVISAISWDENGTDLLISVYYFFDEPEGCKDSDIILRFKSCSSAELHFGNMIKSKKQFGIEKIMPEVEKIEIIKDNGLLSVRIDTNFKNDRICVTCDEIWIEK
ncbi:MAG: hypothetical protein IJW76_02145 [Clostridia bacterium]|nr:hypothetical protein [Clostridia bacterium]